MKRYIVALIGFLFVHACEGPISVPETKHFKLLSLTKTQIA